ncbi:MAG: DUF1073 domain-containing protein [Spirochaetaceae bacterium]|jgi:phage-related protein (TIGR01555 family)|nr:DUF1073 domain-containing protein [Spirochaetaceae bacterium]
MSKGGRTAPKQDGWANVLTGLGGAADKRKYTTADPATVLDDNRLESVYIDDGLGTRIVDLLPDDMFRQGWRFIFDDVIDGIEHAAKAQLYIDIFDNLNLKTKLNHAFKWARLYGGAIVLLGALDGQTLDRRLNPKSIRSFDMLRVIDRSDIAFDRIKFQLDPMKERYGLPEWYPVRFETAAGSRETRFVHHSRVIEVHGKIVPEGMTRTLTGEQRYWGLSVLQNCYETLGTLGGAFGGIGSLLQELSVGVFKISELADILSQPDGKNTMQTRVEVIDLMRSVFRSIYLDKDDEYKRETASFSGVSDVIYQLFMMLSANTGYPITRLFGVSPAGLNSTGESDQLNYYDMVASRQETELAPILRTIVRIIAEWHGIEEPNIVFNPLKQMTEKEKAELEKIREDSALVTANKYQAYINAGIMEPHEARYLQFRDTLDHIPVPEEGTLPPVQPAPEEGDEE